jgi:hypothetical protein
MDLIELIDLLLLSMQEVKANEDYETNDPSTPSWLLYQINNGIHVAVKWNKGPKTLHGRCIAVIDELAVIVSKTDPSKVVTVSVERISEDV